MSLYIDWQIAAWAVRGYSVRPKKKKKKKMTIEKQITLMSFMFGNDNNLMYWIAKSFGYTLDQLICLETKPVVCAHLWNPVCVSVCVYIYIEREREWGQ